MQLLVGNYVPQDDMGQDFWTSSYYWFYTLLMSTLMLNARRVEKALQQRAAGHRRRAVIARRPRGTRARTREHTRSSTPPACQKSPRQITPAERARASSATRRKTCRQTGSVLRCTCKSVTAKRR